MAAIDHDLHLRLLGIDEGCRATLLSIQDLIRPRLDAAVEQQGAATQEIARNVQQAAAGTQSVSNNIQEVTRAASDAGSAAGEVLTVSHTVLKEVDAIRHLVGDVINSARRVASSSWGKEASS